MGIKLGVKRILKCHPFKKLGGSHGIDFVPITKKTLVGKKIKKNCRRLTKGSIRIKRKVKMDRNVFVAIALSMSVLLFWGAFFETPRKTSEQQTNQKVEQKNEQNSIAPTINQPQIIKKLTREESINN